MRRRDRARAGRDPRAGTPPAEGRPQASTWSPRVGPDPHRAGVRGLQPEVLGPPAGGHAGGLGKAAPAGADRRGGRVPAAQPAPHYYPSGGFNRLFEQMLAGFDVRTGVRVERSDATAGRDRGRHGDGEITADLVVATAPIDALLRPPVRAARVARLPGRGRGDRRRQRRARRAPDGVPFAWLYTPWPETPVCRTTDFGVIHHGPERSGPRSS